MATKTYEQGIEDAKEVMKKYVTQQLGDFWARKSAELRRKACDDIGKNVLGGFIELEELAASALRGTVNPEDLIRIVADIRHQSHCYRGSVERYIGAMRAVDDWANRSIRPPELGEILAQADTIQRQPSAQ